MIKVGRSFSPAVDSLTSLSIGFPSRTKGSSVMSSSSMAFRHEGQEMIPQHIGKGKQKRSSSTFGSGIINKFYFHFCWLVC
jgi:hypothetical protein